MTLFEAKHKLALARQRQRKARIEIDILRDIIIQKGFDPDSLHTNLAKRNNDIYKLYEKGMTFKIIAEKFDLSANQIGCICRRRDFDKMKSS